MIRRSVILVLMGATVLAAGMATIWRDTIISQLTTSTNVSVAAGRELYELHCSSCHGANLEGQPDWKVPMVSGRLKAPPHDETGHTWHHSDELLARIIRDGTAAVVGGGYDSDMPGFGEILSDREIKTVLDYIKSTWPERERAYQSRLSRESVP